MISLWLFSWLNDKIDDSYKWWYFPLFVTMGIITVSEGLIELSLLLLQLNNMPTITPEQLAASGSGMVINLPLCNGVRFIIMNILN